MKQFYRGMALLLVLAPLSTTVHAFCMEPRMQETVPDAPMAFLKPSAPFCLSGYRFSRRHTCSEREMIAYIERLKGYTDSVFDYAEKAAAFANSAMNFARHAEDYAKCEAREAKGELQ